MLRSKKSLCGVVYNKLFVQPKCLFGQRGEFLIGYTLQIYAGEVMPDIEQALTDPLSVIHDRGVDQFTRTLWRVWMISAN